MENQNQTTVFNRALNFGLIGALILFIVGIIPGLFIDLEKLVEMNWVNSLIYAVVLFIISMMVIQKRRDFDLGGSISFGKALKVGFLSCLIAVVLASILSYIYYTFVDSSMLEFIKEKSMDEMEKRGMSEEIIQQQRKMMEYIGLFMILGGTLYGAFVGFIVSLINSAIFQTKPKADLV